jgi:hypothetical protein
MQSQGDGNTEETLLVVAAIYKQIRHHEEQI